MIMTRVNFELSKESYKELKSMCLELDISIKELMKSLIDDALNKYKKKVEKPKKEFPTKLRRIPSINRN